MTCGWPRRRFVPDPAHAAKLSPRRATAPRHGIATMNSSVAAEPRRQALPLTARMSAVLFQRQLRHHVTKFRIFPRHRLVAAAVRGTAKNDPKQPGEDSEA